MTKPLPSAQRLVVLHAVGDRERGESGERCQTLRHDTRGPQHHPQTLASDSVLSVL